MGGEREGERLDMAAAAREWLWSNEEAEAILARLARSRWMEVRYEALCLDTEERLRRAFEFAGVDSRASRPRLRSTEHHVIGNGMRLDSSSEVCLDDRWRGIHRADELAVFETVAGAMNRRLGYGPPERVEKGMRLDPER